MKRLSTQHVVCFFLSMMPVLLLSCNDTTFQGRMAKSTPKAAAPTAEPEATPTQVPPTPLPTKQAENAEPAIKPSCTIIADKKMFFSTKQSISPDGSKQQQPLDFDKKITFKYFTNLKATRVLLDSVEQNVANSTLELATDAFAPPQDQDYNNKTFVLQVFDKDNNEAKCEISASFVSLVIESQGSQEVTGIFSTADDSKVGFVKLDLSVANLTEGRAVESAVVDNLSNDIKLVGCRLHKRINYQIIGGVKLFKDTFRCVLANKGSENSLRYSGIGRRFNVTGFVGLASIEIDQSLGLCLHSATDALKCTSENPNFAGTVTFGQSAANLGRNVYPLNFPSQAVLESDAASIFNAQ